MYTETDREQGDDLRATQKNFQKKKEEEERNLKKKKANQDGDHVTDDPPSWPFAPSGT